MIERIHFNSARGLIAVTVAFLIGVAGCSDESSPLSVESEVVANNENVLSAKPHCPDDPTHPSCKGDDDAAPGNGTYVPVTFPDELLDMPGEANGMIDVVGDQTLKYSNTDDVHLNGFNPNYDVALNFAETEALVADEVENGFNDCVAEAKKVSFTSSEMQDLFAVLTDPSQLRYTIVRINLDGLDSEHPEHELFAQFEDDNLGAVTLTIVDSPKVELLTDAIPGDLSGTYRFSGGTMTLRRALGRGGSQKFVCPNQDLVDVVWAFNN